MGVDMSLSPAKVTWWLLGTAHGTGLGTDGRSKVAGTGRLNPRVVSGKAKAAGCAPGLGCREPSLRAGCASFQLDRQIWSEAR